MFLQAIPGCEFCDEKRIKDWFSRHRAKADYITDAARITATASSPSPPCSGESNPVLLALELNINWHQLAQTTLSSLNPPESGALPALFDYLHMPCTSPEVWISHEDKARINDENISCPPNNQLSFYYYVPEPATSAFQDCTSGTRSPTLTSASTSGVLDLVPLKYRPNHEQHLLSNTKWTIEPQFSVSPEQSIPVSSTKGLSRYAVPSRGGEIITFDWPNHSKRHDADHIFTSISTVTQSRSQSSVHSPVAKKRKLSIESASPFSRSRSTSSPVQRSGSDRISTPVLLSGSAAHVGTDTHQPFNAVSEVAHIPGYMPATSWTYSPASQTSYDPGSQTETRMLRHSFSNLAVIPPAEYHNQCTQTDWLISSESMEISASVLWTSTASTTTHQPCTPKFNASRLSPANCVDSNTINPLEDDFRSSFACRTLLNHLLEPNE